MKTILVTGGAGYTGSLLVRLLLDNTYRVVASDNLMYGGDSLLPLKENPHFTFIKSDVTQPKTLKDIFADYPIDTVVHLASIVGDPACARNPKLAKKVNWEGSLNILELALSHNVKRFIFASTCSNYGKMSEREAFVDEDSPLAPISLYAKLKVDFEQVLLYETKKKEGFSPTVLRFATVYGISPRMRFDLTVNEFTKELALGKELEVFGETFWRPYCHVQDFARAILLILKNNKKRVAYEVFNVGDTNENYQKRMIVEEIKKFIPDARVRYIAKDEDPRDYRVSFEKIKKGSGFEISKRVPDGIREVKQLIDSRIIQNPDDQKYRNS